MNRTLLCIAVWGMCVAASPAQEVASLLLRIKAVGREGVGNVEASKAWKELVARGPSVMPDILTGMDDANPVAVNWLRGAVEAIHDRAVKGGQAIPADKLDAFLKDKRHSGRSRRLAYECLVRLDPKTPERLLPKMLDDPGSELRRDAVEVKLKLGLRMAFDDENARKEYFQNLLRVARDNDQVDTITRELKKVGVEIDLTAQFGFVTRWLLMGPFDNVKGVGFNNVYPPEKGFDIKSAVPGKGDDLVKWKEYTSTTKAGPIDLKKVGLVDLNDVFGKLKGAVAYGYAVLESKTERPVEIRAGSNNAVRMYLNGKEIYFREEYHHGFDTDQHVGKGVLKAGRNEILIKVCQNEQTESWTQLWSFQLRVCDALGGAAPVANVTPRVN